MAHMLRVWRFGARQRAAEQRMKEWKLKVRPRGFPPDEPDNPLPTS